MHARELMGPEKDIDKTFRSVELTDSKSSDKTLVISELDAIYYMVSSIFDYRMKYIECTRCDYPHLDKDWFSLHAHQGHLCSGCGRYFRDTSIAIGNPIIGIQQQFNIAPKPTKESKEKLDIAQANFPGGLQIWGSNSAIFWTGSNFEEEGIHVHVYNEDGTKTIFDDTFSEVRIDGISFDPIMVRFLMAQNALPHLEGRVLSLKCIHCNELHFSTGKSAFTPQIVHTCSHCGREFPSKGRLRKVISNPLVSILERLAQKAPRPPQKHTSNLLPETL